MRSPVTSMNLAKDAGEPATGADSPEAALTGSALLPIPMLRTITAPPSDKPVATSRLTIQPGSLIFRWVGASCGSGGAASADAVVWSTGPDGEETTSGAIAGNSGCASGYRNSAVSDGFGSTGAT